MSRSLRFRLPALFLAGIAAAGIVSVAIAFQLLQSYSRTQSLKELRREAAGLNQLISAQAKFVSDNAPQTIPLDPPQLEKQAVELGVRDLRRVEHVVRVLMAADLLAQPLRPLGQVSRTFGALALGHFVSGASIPDRILRPALSNLTTSSSSVRVSVLLTTVPEPNEG